MEKVKYLFSGDSALTVEFSREISEEVNGKIRFLAEKIENDKKSGIIECIPTFRSITVFFEPFTISGKKLIRYIDGILGEYTPNSSGEGRVFEIPVCYEGEYAPDMQSLSEITGLSPEEIIEIHAVFKNEERAKKTIC